MRVGAASVGEGRKPRRRTPRGGAALLVLVVLASAAGIVGITGDGPVSCENLVTTVRTNESSYAPGQTVIISVTLANEGPACSIPTPSPCGPPPAGASAYSSAGEDVWEYGAGTQITCPYEPVTSVSYPAGYSSTQELNWSQDKCALPAGTYRIVGNYGTSERATASITISTRPHSRGHGTGRREVHRALRLAARCPRG